MELTDKCVGYTRNYVMLSVYTRSQISQVIAVRFGSGTWNFFSNDIYERNILLLIIAKYTNNIHTNTLYRKLTKIAEMS